MVRHRAEPSFYSSSQLVQEEDPRPVIITTAPKIPLPELASTTSNGARNLPAALRASTFPS